MFDDGKKIRRRPESMLLTCAQKQLQCMGTHFANPINEHRTNAPESGTTPGKLNIWCSLFGLLQGNPVGKEHLELVSLNEKEGTNEHACSHMKLKATTYLFVRLEIANQPRIPAFGRPNACTLLERRIGSVASGSGLGVGRQKRHQRSPLCVL